MAVGQISEQHPASTQALGGNIPYNGLEWRSTYEAKYHVYVFNVSARKFQNVGRIALTIPGVEADDPTAVKDGDKLVEGKENERYHYITSFPQPILVSRPDDQANQFAFVEQDAVRFVIDFISPDNQSRTLDYVVPQDKAFSIGNDYAQKGVFFSLSNPPQKDDLRKAIDRMEKYYKALLEQAATLELTDKTKLSEQLAANPDYAYAADYFGKEVSWRRKQTRPVECPNCGENKPSGRLFHQTSFGSICIEQTEKAWRAAVNSGVKRKEDVPDDFRWWKDPKAAEQK